MCVCVCVCVCARVCVCCCIFTASCRQNKSSHAVCSLRLLLSLGSHCARLVVGTLWGLCLPVRHTHTHKHTHVYAFGKPGGQGSDRVSSCLALRGEYFGCFCTIFGFCFLMMPFCFSWKPEFLTDKWHMVKGTHSAALPLLSNVRKTILSVFQTKATEAYTFVYGQHGSSFELSVQPVTCSEGMPVWVWAPVYVQICRSPRWPEGIEAEERLPHHADMSMDSFPHWNGRVSPKRQQTQSRKQEGGGWWRK